MYSFNYLFNLCILGVFLIVALFIGLSLRPLLLNLRTCSLINSFPRPV